MICRLLLVALVACAAPAAAQGRWLDTFAVPGTFVGSTDPAVVNAVVPDGAGALVAGDFALVDDVRAVGVARWTGAAWEPLGGGLRRIPAPGDPNPNTGGVGRAAVRAADGAVWVAGTFDAVVQPDGSTLAASGLARWADGAWTVPGRLDGGASDVPVGYALAVQGASVVVGGNFADVIRPDGTALAAGNVARWTAGAWESVAQDGLLIVYALAVLPDGRLLSTGNVETPDGFGATAVEVWDGAAWQPFTRPLDSFAAFVTALHVDGESLYVGGQFRGGLAANGDLVASNNVIRWDGAAWQPLGRGVAGSEVRALATDAAGGLLVGGRIENGLNSDGTAVASPGLVRWTGSAWEPRGVAGERQVLTLARAGTETLVGGRFEAGGGTGNATRRAANVAALSSTGLPRPLSARTGRDGVTGSAFRFAPLAADGCGGVHVFTDKNAGPLPGGVVRTWDGEAWEPVPDGLRTAALLTAFPGGPFVQYFVASLAAVPGQCGAFVLAGQFGGLDANGAVIASPNVVRWTGQSWQPLGRGTDGVLYAVAVAPDGAVTVGGQFTTAFQSDGTPVAVRNVARWTAAGGWEPLGGGVRPQLDTYDRGVYALLAEASGAVTVAGRFDFVVEADGTERPARNVARWTGAAWETFGGPAAEGPFQPVVTSLARWQGALVVSGFVEQVEQPGGSLLDARAVAAYDGAAWSALPGLDRAAEDLAVADGELFVSSGLGVGAARWTGTTWTALDPANPTGGDRIEAVGRSLYLSGDFETAGGVGSPGLAEFDLDGTVAAEPVVAVTAPSRIAIAPNPSRNATTLTFRLGAAGPARLVLVDALGRTVAVLADGERAAGTHTVVVDTSRLPAGVYAARLDAGGTVRAQRLTVVR